MLATAMKILPLFRAVLVTGAFVSALSAAPAARDQFLAAKQSATDANYHNDKTGLGAALAQFGALEADAALGDRARYHAAWCEWMLAASHFQDQQPAEAGRVLESGVARLRAVLARNPDDGETHGLLAWMLMALATSDRARFPELAPQVSEHRKRALALLPASPRNVMLDATMLFYAPKPELRERGLARWQEALALAAAEKTGDPTLPDWGRTLADGWLANLYLTTTPPRLEDARRHAEKALAERPDWWWVKTQVLSKAQTANP